MNYFVNKQELQHIFELNDSEFDSLHFPGINQDKYNLAECFNCFIKNREEFYKNEIEKKRKEKPSQILIRLNAELKKIYYKIQTGQWIEIGFAKDAVLAIFSQAVSSIEALPGQISNTISKSEDLSYIKRIMSLETINYKNKILKSSLDFNNNK